MPHESLEDRSESISGRSFFSLLMLLNGVVTGLFRRVVAGSAGFGIFYERPCHEKNLHLSNEWDF